MLEVYVEFANNTWLKFLKNVIFSVEYARSCFRMNLFILHLEIDTTHSISFNGMQYFYGGNVWGISFRLTETILTKMVATQLASLNISLKQGASQANV